MSADLIDKKSLRDKCLALRAGITVQAAREASQVVSERLSKFIVSNQSIVAGYRAMRAELDITQALQKLVRRGHRVCLPVIDGAGQPLIFRHWLPGQPLEQGLHGTEVPMPQQFSLVPEVVLVPLVAFDRAGHRLGYGAGYYDRTLAVLRAKKPVRVIGVGYSVQEVGKIPADAHDQKLDAIVTEKEVIIL